MRRYQRERPGEVLHLGVKELDRISGIGHQFRSYRSNRLRNPVIGWAFAHVALDDASRVPVATVAANELAGSSPS